MLSMVNYACSAVINLRIHLLPLNNLMTSFILSPLEQFDLLNLKDWSLFNYAFIFTNTNAQFFFVLALVLLSLFFFYYNRFWLTQEKQHLTPGADQGVVKLTFHRFTSLRSLPQARYSAVTLASVVHLLSVAFFGMLSHKYYLGFDVAPSKTVVEAALATATLTAPAAPLATAIKLGFLKTVGFSYKLAQPIPLPFITGDGTVEGAMKVIANHTFYLCFWDLDLPSRVALVRTLSATGDYGRLFLYASPLHNGLHISVKLLQVLSSPRNAAEQARALAIVHVYGLDHPINCYQWLIMRVPLGS